MVTSLKHTDLVIGHEVHETIRFVDATRPGATQKVPQWLWLADAIERIAQRVDNERVEALQSFSILGLPVNVIGPSERVEG